MSIILTNIHVSGLKPSERKRYLKINFRGEEQHSKPIEIKNNKTKFPEDLAWTLTSSVTNDDSMLCQLFSKNNLFNDRLLGKCKLTLEKLVTSDTINCKGELDNESQHIEIQFTVKYRKPDETNELPLSQTDCMLFVNEEALTNLNSFSLDGFDGIISGTIENESQGSNIEPKINLPEPVFKQQEEWQLHVNILCGKNLVGQSLDPIVYISVGEEKKETTIKKASVDPVWNEQFIFVLTGTKQDILSTIFRMKVCSGGKSHVIGEASFDLYMVYNEFNHEINKKYAILQEPGGLQINGYILTSFKIIATEESGDARKFASVSNELEIDDNLLLPVGSHQPREVFDYHFKVFRGNSIISTLAITKIKSFFNKNPADSLDCYIKVTFGKKSVQTKSHSGTAEPEFNEDLIIQDFFPPMFHTVQFELFDKESYSSDELLASYVLPLQDVIKVYDLPDDDDSSDGRVKQSDAMPCFGPVWIDLYGLFQNQNITKKLSCPKDGNINRGRIYIELNIVPANRKQKHKPTDKKKLKEMPSQQVSSKEFFLFGTLCGASMIDKRIGLKPISFEITFGPHAIDASVEAVYFTDVYTPEASINNFYNQIDIGNEKPCFLLKSDLPDLRFRLKLEVVLSQIIFRFESDLKKKSTLAEAQKRNCLDSLLKELKEFNNFQEREGNMKQLFNKLDQQLYLFRKLTVKSLIKQISSTLKLASANDIENSQLEEFVSKVLEELYEIAKPIQPSFPDVIFWMIQDNKRVGHARIPMLDILYSESEEYCGRNCGIVQPIFIQDCASSADSRYDDLIKAKLDVRMWFGIPGEDSYCNIPNCFEIPKPIDFFPSVLNFMPCSKFSVMRAHIYQGRMILGTDDSRLSDPFVRVTFGYTKDTRTVFQNNSPVWGETLVFEGLHLFCDEVSLKQNPPVVVLEVFDNDIESNSTEFIGRCLAYPTPVKSPQEQAAMKMKWHKIMIGNRFYGEILAGFELLEPDNNFTENLSFKAKNGFFFNPMPELFLPRMAYYRLELLLWGVREMKRYQGFKVIRPQVTVDFGYDLDGLDKKHYRRLHSEIIENASRKPNFHDQIHIFDCRLPIEEEYMTTLTFRLLEHQRFGRVTLIGTYTSTSLSSFICRDSKAYSKYFNANAPRVLQKAGKKKGQEKKKQKSATKEKAVVTTMEEPLDWWSRYYASEKDMFESNGYEREQTKDEKSITRIKIYRHELEKEFGNFNDFLFSFPIKRGKSNFFDEDNPKNLKAVVKGAIRIWRKDQISADVPILSNPKGTFQSLPSNKPVKLLVRLYCIAAKNLMPKDSSGKSDPYVVVKYAGKKYGNSEDHVANSINPEFGKLFEMEGSLPFDNKISVEVYDWDFSPFPDDLIGITEIDIENRFYSRHQPCCGLSMTYDKSGYSAWRHPLTPSAILSDLCKNEGRGEPNYNGDYCTIDGSAPAKRPKKEEKNGSAIPEKPPEKITIENGPGVSMETKALDALHNYERLPDGYRLVPEHVETRMLHLPGKPNMPQGELCMWLDIFPTDQCLVTPPVDVAKRKPKEYELRVIVRNCEKVPLVEKSVMLGTKSSDIMVRAWLDGMYEEKQKTDVHYRSTDGVGMFNWRFIFPFSYQSAKKQVVHKTKLSMLSLEQTEQFFPPVLIVQCMEADIFSSDVLGELRIPLLQIPSFYGKSSGWSYSDYQKRQNKDLKELPSIFKNRSISGWWPFKGVKDGKVVDSESGRVQLEIELLTSEEAKSNPAGLRRDEPQPLEKPNRPEESMQLFLSPIKTLQLIYMSYRWYCLKVFLVLLALLLLFLFIYAMPGLLARKSLSI